MPKEVAGVLLTTLGLINREHPFAEQLPGDAILLMQRGAGTRICPSMWAGPAGELKSDESHLKAAKRELEEEISEIDLVGSMSEIFNGTWDTGPGADRRHCIFFTSQWCLTGIPALRPSAERHMRGAPEMVGFGWFTKEDALTLPLATVWRQVIEEYPS